MCVVCGVPVDDDRGSKSLFGTERATGDVSTYTSLPLSTARGAREDGRQGPGRVYLVAQDNRLAGSQRDRQAIERDSQHQSGNATP